MIPNLRVRRALLNLPEDATAYRDMLNRYAADPVGQGAPLDDATLDKVLNDLSNHPCCYPFLAFIDEKPVGFATCFLGYSTFKAAPLLNVHDIAVIPELRLQGIGRTILQEIAEEGVKLGCCRLTLEVREDNPAALALYQRSGFDICRRGEKQVAHQFMERPLASAT